MTFDERYAEYLGMIEPALAGYFGRKEGLPFDGLLESMDYSLTAGRQAPAPDAGAGVLPHLRRRRGGGPAGGLRR